MQALLIYSDQRYLNYFNLCTTAFNYPVNDPASPMRNKQVLLGFNRDPQKVQQYTCNSNENKMADAAGGPARVMGLMAMPLTR